MKTRLERGKSMKRKNGFTLIELLAVIVILAIIALIAVPVVMNIISKANKSAFKDSAYGILKAGENYYMGELLKAEGMTEDKVFDFSKDTSELEINGSKPTDGKMIVNTNGKVAMAIHNGKHCVKKGFEDDDVTITNDVENCKLPGAVTIADLATTHSFTSADGTTTSEVSEVDGCAKSGICEAGTAFAIKVNNTETYKFYVLSDTGKEITLIMDRNLYGEKDSEDMMEFVEWCKFDDYIEAGGTEEEYGTDGNNNKGPLTALRILKDRTKTWTNISEREYLITDDNENKVYQDIRMTMRARLLTYTEANELISANSNMLPTYLVENINGSGSAGYWLSTANIDNSIAAWHIDSLNGFTAGAYFSGDNAGIGEGGYFNIRPVITLSK